MARKPNAASGASVRQGKVPRELPCVLTADEHAMRSRQLATVDDDIRATELDRKVYSAQCNAKIKALKEQQEPLCDAVNTGRELRTVTCYWHDDLVKQERVLIREDTGEEVDRRAMSGDELQLDMAGSLDGSVDDYDQADAH